MITPSQIRAARAYLGISGAELAKMAGIQTSTLSLLENGKSSPEVATIEKIMRALQNEGIEFTQNGIQKATPIYHFKGAEWFLDLLDDIEGSGAKEVIIENVDPRKSSPAVLKKFRELRAAGVTFRLTAERGNTYLTFPVSFYRWVDSGYFKNWVRAIYGDRVATKTSGVEPGCIVIRDRDVADAERSRFQYVWDHEKPLTIESTANDRIE